MMCFGKVELKIVFCAPGNCLINVFIVVSFIVIGNETYKISCAICILTDINRATMCNLGVTWLVDTSEKSIH